MDANGGVKLMLYFATLKPSLVSLVSINGDTPIAGWPIRENPTDMDDDWGYPYDLGNPTIYIYPIGSMYGLHGDIYLQYTPNVSIYTIHGSYGYYIANPNLTRW